MTTDKLLASITALLNRRDSTFSPRKEATVDGLREKFAPWLTPLPFPDLDEVEADGFSFLNVESLLGEASAYLERCLRIRGDWLNLRGRQADLLLDWVSSSTVSDGNRRVSEHVA